MKKLYFMVMLFVFPAMTFSMPELKGSPEELQKFLLGERSIVTISGFGEEELNADMAIVSLVVKTKEDKLRTALDKNL